MNRVQTATYTGERLGDYLAAVSRSATDDVGKTLKPVIDDALRALGYSEAEIPTAAPESGSEAETDLRVQVIYRALLQIPGVGPVLAAIFVAEIGDITRFARPEQLASWAGLTPKHHESDTTVHRGRITKQGSRLVRWAAIEAVQRLPGHTRIGQVRDRVAARRGRNIGVVAAARELLTLVFYGLRDHRVHALAVHSPARTPLPA